MVVALVVAVVVLPLWFGGGQTNQGRVVEIQPGGTDSDGGEAPGSGEDTGPSAGDAVTHPLEEGGDAEEEGQEKWWRRTVDGGEAASDDPSAAAAEQVLPDQGKAGSGGDRSQVQAPEEAEAESVDPSEPEEPEETADPPAEQTAARESGGEAGAQAPGMPDAPFWGVMVGSFQDPGNAKGLRDRLQEQGYEVSVVPTKVKGRQWHRVIVGSGESREAVQDLVPSLEETGFENLLVIEIEEGPASS
ncbi:hypothetical protein AN478_06510 [Thiohalorhabdus denitrificans]|nr:hypothetical protein AN478_06510 [Thiohalorhabdus denitrificans]